MQPNIISPRGHAEITMYCSRSLQNANTDIWSKKDEKMIITWSSRRALIPIFFLLKDLENSSTVIGSNNASGPSSEIGGFEAGCVNCNSKPLEFCFYSIHLNIENMDMYNWFSYYIVKQTNFSKPPLVSKREFQTVIQLNHNQKKLL